MNSRWLVQGNGAGNGRRFSLVLLFVLSLGLLALPRLPAAAAGAIFYVMPGASGSGASWADPASLQDALGTATSGDEIWVAAGEYVPGAAESDSFQLVPGVAVYGGFAGTETALEERDWAANLTVLSGDIGGDDTNKVDGVVMDTGSIVGGNSDHVVYADGTTGTPISGTTILDGFTVTAGQADGSGIDENGGGFYCAGDLGGECSLSLRNVTFTGNLATYGGAMYIIFGSPTLTDVSFSGNRADYGGALYNREGTFSGPSLTNVSFSGNTADFGGALYNNNSSPNLTNVSFSANTAIFYGGAMCNVIAGNPSLTNVSFFGNIADSGGAMYNFTAGSPTLTNVILWGDSAGTSGPEIYNDPGSPTISHSVIAGGVGSIPGAVDGGNNISDDPRYVDAANGDLRLRFDSPAIDAGDNGAPGLSGVLTDLAGNPRIIDGDHNGTATIDMGAYELQCPLTSTLFVDQAATGLNNGSDWENAQTNLRTALENAVVCDVAEIWVAAGEYVPGVSENDSFYLVPGVAVYGGFAGTETAREERDWVANLTVLSGDIGNDDANKVNGVVMNTADIVGGNSDHVVYADGATGTPVTATTILDGFTISAGQADGSGFHTNGAGFYCDGRSAGECSPTLRNIAFTGNLASYGGALVNDGGGGGSSPSLINVSFSGNEAAVAGGAMLNYGYGGSSSPVLTNVSFHGNAAGNRGGAMANDGRDGGSSSPILTNVILWGDSAGSSGPEIYNDTASPTISHSLIAGGMGSIPGAVDGGGNLSDDPLLVDAASGDLHLQPGSPAVDAGDNGAPGLGGIVTDLDGSDRFVDGDGDALLMVDMGAYEAQIQAIGLAGGWNLVSLYRQPDDPGLEAVLGSIETEVVLLKNGQGQVYWPAYGVNQIGSWQVSEGYQIYLSAPATLFAGGAQVDPEATAVPLAAGWNMAAYLCDESMAVATALDSISEELLLVKDGDGNVYWPDLGMDYINDMVPGEGYQIFMESAGTLVYPGS